jgi:hypothetical protein
MPHVTPATAAAFHTAHGAAGNARPHVGIALVALLLGLLARLFRRADATWHHLPHLTDDHDGAYTDPYAEDFVYVIPFVSRAIHAICVEAGLVPCWIFAGRPCRGMRALPNRTHTRTRTLAARAPPIPALSHA